MQLEAAIILAVVVMMIGAINSCDDDCVSGVMVVATNFSTRSQVQEPLGFQSSERHVRLPVQTLGGCRSIGGGNWVCTHSYREKRTRLNCLFR